MTSPQTPGWRGIDHLFFIPGTGMGFCPYPPPVEARTTPKAPAAPKAEKPRTPARLWPLAAAVAER